MVDTIKLDIIQTLSVAAVVYYVGILAKRYIKIFDRLNIPSAVVGGILFALIVLIVRNRFFEIQFDTSTQPLFNVAFFTTIGMSASLPLLKKGGLLVGVFFLISAFFCLIQNMIGMGIASLFGINPLVGVIAGSVTLVGGPATGIAFAPLFQRAGVIGADIVALTAATFGIVCGGIFGGPVGTWLINKHNIVHHPSDSQSLRNIVSPTDTDVLRINLEREDSPFVVNVVLLTIAMGIGTMVSGYFESLGWTLPAYIGAMLSASVIRNTAEATGWFKIDQRTMDFIGSVSLNIFLTVALMNLKLWELLELAVPITAILVAQVVVVILFAISALFYIMGRDYESAVISSGFIGFVLGTTANALANMKTVVNRYGDAPRAFLVVPLVGAFFIDFINAIIITAFINWLT